MQRLSKHRRNLFGMTFLMTAAMLFAACGGDDNDEPSNPTPPPTPQTPEEEYEPPVTHIYSEDSSTEAVVKEVRSDGTVVLDASTAKEIPQKGEIIVSGITEAAPYGFLYHVESVQQSNGQIILKTSEASLNEVIQKAHIQQPLELKVASSESEAAPMTPYLAPINNGPARAKDVSLNFKKKFTIPKKPITDPEVFYIDEELFKEYIQGTVTVGLNLGATFIYDSDDWLPDRCGIMLNGSLSTKLDIEVGVIANWEEKFADIPLQPIGFLLFGVPVVIEPEVQFRCGIKPSGKMYAKWTPLDVEALNFDTRLIWNRQSNAYGENWDYGYDYGSDFANWSWKDCFKDMANFEVGISGDVKFAVWPEIRFKLYNSESVSMAIGVSPYAKLAGEMAFKWKAKDWTWDDVLFKDELTLSAGADLSLEGKMEFKIPFTDKKLGGKIEKDIGVIDVPLVERSTLFSTFNDFLIYPENNVMERDNVHISANKCAPFMSLFADYEEDFGFCIAKDNGQTKEWKYYSLKSKYPSSSGDVLIPTKVELDIPTSSLEANATYVVRPYVKTNLFTLKRKGGTFKTGGTLPQGGVIIDVPGSNL